MLRGEEFICYSTGEILTGEEIVKSIISEKTENKKRQIRGLNIRKSKEELQWLLDYRYGAFSFNRYQKVIEVFTSDNVFDGATCFKFVYLTTFMDYDNKLYYGSKYGDKHRGLMTIKDLPEVLKISRKQAITIRDKLIAVGAITVDNKGNITVNVSLVSKGRLKAGDKRNSVRIFEDTIKELYEKLTVREHARLATFIQLLPYINIYHNSICFNADEKDVRLIDPMSMTDICRLLGLNVSKASRIERELFEVRVAGEYMIGKFIRHGKTSYCVNPRVYYKGSNSEHLKALGDLFLVGTGV